MKGGFAALGAVLLCSLFADPGLVQARRSSVERAYAGKVVILKKRPPMRFASQGAWMHFLRANRMEHVWPDKKEKNRWLLEFMAFFRRALNDLEVNVKFYDITEGKKFIAADSFYMNRGQTIFASNVELTTSRFTVNRKYLMQILTSRSELLASTTFWLRGKGEVYSGKVTFTDDEAKLKD